MKVLQVAAIAAFLLSVAHPMDAKADERTEAYVTALKATAAMRVAWENCADITSAIRETTEMMITWADTFKVMPRSKAIDVIQDEAIMERVRTGRECRDLDAKNDAWAAASNAFIMANRKAREAQAAQP